MQERFSHFLSNEDGAVTVDWVVLTAAIVGISVLAVSTISRGATDEAGGLAAVVAARPTGV